MLLLYLFVMATCGIVTSGKLIPFSEIDIAGIVNGLNSLRSNVRPQAANMKALVWSDSLARTAQLLSSSCDLARSSRYIGVIQTISGHSNRIIDSTIQSSWFRQENFYSYGSNLCSIRQGCYSYLQLVNADSVEVGCATATCDFIPLFPPKYGTIHTCYFSPEYNVNGRPYSAGPPCSNCPSGYTCNSTLCQLDSVHATNITPPVMDEEIEIDDDKEKYCKAQAATTTIGREWEIAEDCSLNSQCNSVLCSALVTFDSYDNETLVEYKLKLCQTPYLLEIRVSPNPNTTLPFIKIYIPRYTSPIVVDSRIGKIQISHFQGYGNTGLTFAISIILENKYKIVFPQKFMEDFTGCTSKTTSTENYVFDMSSSTSSQLSAEIAWFSMTVGIVILYYFTL